MPDFIIVDDREVTQHPDIPEKLGIPCKVERLEAADFCFLDRGNNPIGIERSEIGNLVQKFMDGELESQLYKCQDAYSHIILLKEGVYDKVGEQLAIYKKGGKGYFPTHIYPRLSYSHIKAMEAKLGELGLEIIDTANFECSLTMIETLYNQRRKPEEASTLFKRTRSLIMPTKLTNNPAVARLIALIPRLGEKVAIRLINTYGSIWNIALTTDKDLAKVEGVSKTTILKLREGLGQPNDWLANLLNK